MRKKAAARLTPYLEMSEGDLKRTVKTLDPQDLGQLTDLMKTLVAERKSRFALYEESIKKDSPNREELLNLKRPDVQAVERRCNIFLKAFTERHVEKQRR